MRFVSFWPMTQKHALPRFANSISIGRKAPFPGISYTLARWSATSLLTKLFAALENNDLSSVREMVEVLAKKEPDNPDYALAGLVVAMNEITPLHLVADDYADLLEKALLGKPNGLNQRMKESAAHFATIVEILNEFLAVPHGPSPALIDVLRRFVARLEKACCAMRTATNGNYLAAPQPSNRWASYKRTVSTRRHTKLRFHLCFRMKSIRGLADDASIRFAN